jgi:hypothetical protein
MARTTIPAGSRKALEAVAPGYLSPNEIVQLRLDRYRFVPVATVPGSREPMI